MLFLPEYPKRVNSRIRTSSTGRTGLQQEETMSTRDVLNRLERLRLLDNVVSHDYP